MRWEVIAFRWSENSCSSPRDGRSGTEIKEWSSGPVVPPEIRFRSRSCIQIILRPTAICRVAIYQSHACTPSTQSNHLSARSCSRGGAAALANCSDMLSAARLLGFTGQMFCSGKTGDEKWLRWQIQPFKNERRQHILISLDQNPLMFFFYFFFFFSPPHLECCYNNNNMK